MQQRAGILTVWTPDFVTLAREFRMMRTEILQKELEGETGTRK
jgi:hypothetical protein